MTMTDVDAAGHGTQTENIFCLECDFQEKTNKETAARCIKWACKDDYNPPLQTTGRS